VVAGDFNASRDHRPFRDLLAAGFRDYADSSPHRSWPGFTWPASREDAARHAPGSCAGLTDRHGAHGPRHTSAPVLITTVCWPPLSSPRNPMNSLLGHLLNWPPAVSLAQRPPSQGIPVGAPLDNVIHAVIEAKGVPQIQRGAAVSLPS
jgi:hypothetical protein